MHSFVYAKCCHRRVAKRDLGLLCTLQRLLYKTMFYIFYYSNNLRFGGYTYRKTGNDRAVVHRSGGSNTYFRVRFDCRRFNNNMTMMFLSGFSWWCILYDQVSSDQTAKQKRNLAYDCCAFAVHFRQAAMDLSRNAMQTTRQRWSEMTCFPCCMIMQ